MKRPDVTMSVAALLDDAAAPTIMVNGLTEDSRSVSEGDAFVAVQGQSSDGHDFALEAEKNGAACVLAEHPLVGLTIPVVRVARLRVRRGALAARFYADPSGAMTCVGVTGTNGKTSIAHYVADMASKVGVPCGYLGTLGWGQPPEFEPSNLTTEDAITTQRRLACLRQNGCRWVALETSSHALAQGRVDDVQFAIGVFSNLTRDHFDYHDDIDTYGAAKQRLFEFDSLGLSVLNVDDAFGRHLHEVLEQASGREVVTYGGDGDIRWQDVAFHDYGLSAELLTPWGSRQLTLPVFGEFSLSNVAAAIAVLCSAGLPFAAVVEAAHELTPVPGRMEFFRQPGRPTVVVDYAHTPDALTKVLAALRIHCRGRLVCTVGCGGDRDAGKRPMMAKAAVRGADVVWLTSDNPRSEDPQAIIDQMRAGLDDETQVFDVVDRHDAIRRAVTEARSGDLVVVAGKGHENYQEVQGKRIPFSDREIVRDLLAASSGEMLGGTR
ncbi:MAG: UDP-N-acetylmuramoyl-L-alanyl-D-glutamate--2,6-diaminopimelate ligase [Gammaproteobacteria bacterium]|nr:UDP-N-acetylmuramoyl-L-alanyl-D-glutamate--2,6-diaminopimelate ligase [Gammaproteobacteria bacterium]